MLATLRSECQKCTWELPADFTDINFHLIGTDTKPWLPPDSDELAIISPFVRDNALIKLLNTTDNAQLLLARDEELDGIKAETIGKFKLRKVLAEQAKTEDGEDANTRNSGLHAKAYILQKGWYTHLIMGSANASDRVMDPDVTVRNLEILVELRGLKSKVGGIDSLLSEKGLADILTDYQSPDPDEPKKQVSTEEKTLERVRGRLSQAVLALACKEIEGSWQLSLTASEQIDFEEAILQVWPLSIPRDRAVSAQALPAGGKVILETLSLEQVTTLIGFGLTLGKENLCFGLEVPIDSLPEGRDAAIMRLVVRNRDGFMRYLLMMLEDLSGTRRGKKRKNTRGKGDGHRIVGEDFPLFEILAKLFRPRPKKLDSRCATGEETLYR